MTAFALPFDDVATAGQYATDFGRLADVKPGDWQVLRADRPTENGQARALVESGGSVSWAGLTRRLLNALLDQAGAAASGFSIIVHAPPAQAEFAEAPVPKGSALATLRLVEKWLAEDDGYDATAWPVIQQRIQENRLSYRSRFDG